MAKKKILIVDDEEKFVRMVKMNLEETGEYEVQTETDGRKAVSVAQQFKPDLILLDVIMPEIDGGEVAQEISAKGDLKDIPIVFLTAIVEQEEAESPEGTAGGYDFIAKPVSVEDLIDGIEKHIKQ